MSGNRLDAALARLRGLASLDRWRAAVRPRRALLPAVAYWSLWALVVLHRPFGRVNASDHCHTVQGCRQQLDYLLAEEPLAVAGYAGYHVVAAVAVYLLAALVTAAAGWRVDLRERAPRLFAPDDRELWAVGGGLLLALVGYVAGTYGAAYSVVAAVVLYVVYFPLLVVVVGVTSAPVDGPVLAGLPDPVAAAVALVVGVVFFLALPALEVLWLYALATGAVRAARQGTAEAGETGTGERRHADD